MPNLILKSNIANKTFNIQHKVLRMPVKPGVVELTVTPISRYNIDAKDFSSGLLPKEVSKVEYTNLGNSVIARVFIKSVIDSKRPVNIFIPVSGRSFVKKDSFKVTETTTADNRVFISELSTNEKSTNGNKTTYSVNNSLGKKSLVFSKKFLVFGYDYFSTEPSYVIKNNNDRYTVATALTVNTKNQITGKSFDFFYTSPDVVVQSVDTEISFAAKSTTLTSRVRDEVAKEKQEEKIYSVDYGRSIGKEGGLKTITVKGVPGTTFQFLISNQDKETYSARTGKFEAGGGIINGVIPKQQKGNFYGAWTFTVKIPRTILSQEITIQLVGGAPVNHEKILESKNPVVTAVAATNPSGPPPTVLATSVAVLKIEVDSRDTTTSVDFTSEIGGEASIIMLGKEGREVLEIKDESGGIIDTTKISFIVLAASGKFITIDRQPRFEMPSSKEDNFVAWDSGSNKAEGITNAGVEIPSDWNFDFVTDAAGEPTSEKTGLGGGVKIKTKLKATGLGKPDSAEAFPAVLIEGVLDVGSVGKNSSTVKLRLHNFLSQVTPS